MLQKTLDSNLQRLVYQCKIVYFVLPLYGHFQRPLKSPTVWQRMLASCYGMPPSYKGVQIQEQKRLSTTVGRSVIIVVADLN